MTPGYHASRVGAVSGALSSSNAAWSRMIFSVRSGIGLTEDRIVHVTGGTDREVPSKIEHLRKLITPIDAILPANSGCQLEVDGNAAGIEQAIRQTLA